MSASSVGPPDSTCSDQVCGWTCSGVEQLSVLTVVVEIDTVEPVNDGGTSTEPFESVVPLNTTVPLMLTAIGRYAAMSLGSVQDPGDAVYKSVI